MSPIESRALFDEFLMRLEAYKALSDEERDDEAGILLRSALGMLSAICGPDLIGRAYGPADQPEDRKASKKPPAPGKANEAKEARRGISLEALSERLHICSRLFASVEDFGAGGTVREAAQEAYLVANGDKPRLFAPIKKQQKQRASAYALAMCKCRALEWDAYLSILGEKAATRKEHIALAYGVTMDAIAKWPAEVRKYLGEDAVRYRLDVAGRLAAKGLDLGPSLHDDGQTYQRQLRA